MNIVVFTHPDFLDSTSMPRFARMIIDGMRSRGHTVEQWTAKPCFYKLPVRSSIKKWFGYIDQYVLFPLLVLLRLYRNKKNTLYVFSDQALGPWIPLVKKHPHVIHVHDFMAYHSAHGRYPENPISKTGKLYQAYIKNGFSKGKCFISVSQNTKKELDTILGWNGDQSFVVYNGLNPIFRLLQKPDAIALLKDVLPEQALENGFLLHVGGNQWYKNRAGVLEIYDGYTKKESNDTPLPLVMIGAVPPKSFTEFTKNLPETAAVYFLSGLSDEQVCAAYSLATLFLFPSIAEGFGWPIAEAMACGCPVITTGEAPMTEVGGEAAIYIDRRPVGNAIDWAEKAACQLRELLADESRMVAQREKGIQHVKQFNAESTLDAYERIYLQELNRTKQ
ncbi:glycosyltransferase family 4 protein [Aeromonas veronii]|uniref:glycosyltransferase family 4 protein n=1 Tax=Aeromonas veronii TaxID=654 RepID=UPI001F438213|nr:glycosyltransferase family 1 protein [Aeromonas veronii]MCF5910718.1 glycosyltransferase family 4 protein [Aeromonas veronii]